MTTKIFFSFFSILAGRIVILSRYRWHVSGTQLFGSLDERASLRPSDSLVTDRFVLFRFLAIQLARFVDHNSQHSTATGLVLFDVESALEDDVYVVAVVAVRIQLEAGAREVEGGNVGVTVVHDSRLFGSEWFGLYP